MVLSSILRKTIKDRNLTIIAVARATKIPVQTLHGWLQGSEPKSRRQLKAVADYLEVDLDYLCFGIKPKQASNKIEMFEHEINAGVFEVVLRRIKKFFLAVYLCFSAVKQSFTNMERVKRIIEETSVNAITKFLFMLKE